MNIRDRERRSLELTRRVVAKLRREPALYQHVRETLTHWLSRESNPCWLRWQAVIDDPEACIAIALEDSDRGVEMRKCSPFCGVLTERERQDFLTEWKHVNG